MNVNAGVGFWGSMGALVLAKVCLLRYVSPLLPLLSHLLFRLYIPLFRHSAGVSARIPDH